MANTDKKYGFTDDELLYLKKMIKAEEGTAASLPNTTPSINEEGALKPVNVRIGSNFGGYLDIVSLTRAYRKEGWEDKSRDFKKKRYDRDKKVVNDFISSLNAYRQDQSSDNKKKLDAATDAYFAAGGNVTVGYGAAILDPTKFKQAPLQYADFNEEQANAQFEKDFTEHADKARRLMVQRSTEEGVDVKNYDFDKAPAGAKMAVISGVYNSSMGKWPKFGKHFVKGEYDKAAAEVIFNDKDTQDYTSSTYVTSLKNNPRPYTTAKLLLAKTDEDIPAWKQRNDPLRGFLTTIHREVEPEIGNIKERLIPPAGDVMTENILFTRNREPTLYEMLGSPTFSEGPVEKPAPAPAPAPVSQKVQEEKPKKVQPSSGDSPKDYSDYPFKEAFDMAKNRDKQKIFYWEGRPFTTVTGDELLAKAAKKEPELPAKDGGVEDIFGGPIESPALSASRRGIEKQAAADLEEDISATEKAFTKAEAKDPFADVGLEEVSRTPDGESKVASKSKVSDILKKTTEPDYDKMSFAEAFRKKRAKGEREFPWRGKTYTTKYKEEM